MWIKVVQRTGKLKYIVAIVGEAGGITSVEACRDFNEDCRKPFWGDAKLLPYYSDLLDVLGDRIQSEEYKEAEGSLR